MKKDGSWRGFFEDPSRFADAVNGFGCNGEQVVTKEDIKDADTRLFRSGKERDIVRKVIRGVNYLIIGIEPQETVDYSLPLRNMVYDTSEYERQAAKIRKEVREHSEGLSKGEYLYGFKKDTRLNPVVTFILYSGEEAWTGPTCLHDILDFTDVPEELRKLIPNYKIHVISVKDIKDTSIFQTDLRYVLEFLKCAKDKEKLKTLVENTPYYQNMDEDAYDVIANYANVKKLVEKKDEYKDVQGGMDMCTAIKEMMEDSRREGIAAGILEEKEKTEREHRRAEEAKLRTEQLEKEIESLRKELERLKNK